LSGAGVKAGAGAAASPRAPGGAEALEILDVRYERIPMEPFREPPGAQAAAKVRED